MIEFIGFKSQDFDFFKKKDKLSKEEYESMKNDLKQCYRAMCYEVQKIYHSKTGGFFDVDKEFQNFNKKSMSLMAQHIINDSKSSIICELNCDNISIYMTLPTSNEDLKGTIDILKNKKNMFMDAMTGNKNTLLYTEMHKKSKELETIKFNGIEINNKNYENFVNTIENGVKAGNSVSIISIKYVFNKNECIKLGKSFVTSAYDCIIKLNNMYSSLYE